MEVGVNLIFSEHSWHNVQPWLTFCSIGSLHYYEKEEEGILSLAKEILASGWLPVQRWCIGVHHATVLSQSEVGRIGLFTFLRPSIFSKYRKTTGIHSRAQTTGYRNIYVLNRKNDARPPEKRNILLQRYVKSYILFKYFEKWSMGKGKWNYR